MRVAVVGPTHPYKGGIAHHTTELAHRLSGLGHDVSLISWSEQYPERWYPGVLRVPQDKPETAPHPNTSYPLSWKNPIGWIRVGRQLRAYDLVVFVFVASVQAPAYLTVLKARGKKCRGRVIALCHNVLPHERRFFDAPLTRAVLKRVDRVLVHTPAQAEVARGLVDAAISVADLPPHLPARPEAGVEPRVYGHHRRLLFFGLVRKYKGLDVLLRALARVPNIQLTVAGEFWDGAELYQNLIAELGIRERVTLHSGYVASVQIPALFSNADALVLPYRAGTATQNVYLANAHGRPVIATRVGSMSQHVSHDVDGLLCQPDSVAELAEAIEHFYEPGVAQKLYENLPEVTGNEAWGSYLSALLGEAAHA